MGPTNHIPSLSSLLSFESHARGRLRANSTPAACERRTTVACVREEGDGIHGSTPATASTGGLAGTAWRGRAGRRADSARGPAESTSPLLRRRRRRTAAAQIDRRQRGSGDGDGASAFPSPPAAGIR
uniref:Uncharacterized protein n=1 Tax=Leersia perrieri TaxID=77586 RepID=A0A0D9WX68_9ORYZ